MSEETENKDKEKEQTNQSQDKETLKNVIKLQNKIWHYIFFLL